MSKEREEMQRSYLKIYPGQALFIGRVHSADFHRHRAVQISLSLDEPFCVETDRGERITHGVMINTDVRHNMNDESAWQILILMDPETIHHDNMFSDEGWNVQEVHVPPSVMECVKGMADQPSIYADKIREMLMQAMNMQLPSNAARDPRLDTIIKTLNRNDDNTPSVERLAASVHLSISRLQHVFKYQMGISIQSYRLWRKMMWGVEHAVEGQDLTQAAHAAGFSDSAHMSRTFRRMFGITLSSMFKNDRYVQVQLASME